MLCVSVSLFFITIPSADSETRESPIDKRRARAETTRQNILDTAVRCYRERGVAATTMEEVARQSGVGRATVYRHFPNQNELLAQLITREMGEIQALLHSALPRHHRCEDYLVECALIILRESPRRALTRALFDAPSAGSIAQLAMSDDRIAALGANWLEPFYRRASEEGILRSWVNPATLQEWITRILVSFLSAPGTAFEDEQTLRQFFYDAVVPSIIQRPVS